MSVRTIPPPPASAPTTGFDIDQHLRDEHGDRGTSICLYHREPTVPRGLVGTEPREDALARWHADEHALHGHQLGHDHTPAAPNPEASA